MDGLRGRGVAGDEVDHDGPGRSLCGQFGQLRHQAASLVDRPRARTVKSFWGTVNQHLEGHPLSFARGDYGLDPHGVSWSDGFLHD
ncbi:hypothetical protein ABZ930_07025 [Streptomyces sp. NPDC046716]|uniref:hypothetical protein n=1 Tax=Streptomyces sp. NPDC046716 TaxID=3157093 RepID=UPI00340DC519